jgi:hypothetical protein
MSDAQNSIPHGRRRLRRIDRELRRSDPELASMLAIFARLNAGEAMPGWEQLRAPPAPGWHVLLWPIASVAFLLGYAAGGGAGTPRGAALACGVRRRGQRRSPPPSAAAVSALSGRPRTRAMRPTAMVAPIKSPKT